MRISKKNKLQTNLLSADEVKFEFRKTARHEVQDQKTEGQWDQFGRFFTIYGMRRPGPFDNEKRNIYIYSIFGEPLHHMEKIPQLG